MVFLLSGKINCILKNYWMKDVMKDEIFSGLVSKSLCDFPKALKVQDICVEESPLREVLNLSELKFVHG